ncbi:MAG: hypothetical protein ACRC14_05350, partial [Paracoccaceae bacterium]
MLQSHVLQVFTVSNRIKSDVDKASVNQLVVGSIPTAGASILDFPWKVGRIRNIVTLSAKDFVLARLHTALAHTDQASERDGPRRSMHAPADDAGVSLQISQRRPRCRSGPRL